MHEWVGVADRLRTVQMAEMEFVIRSMVDQSIIGPMLLDRLAADVLEVRGNSGGYMQKKPARRDDES